MSDNFPGRRAQEAQAERGLAEPSQEAKLTTGQAHFERGM